MKRIARGTILPLIAVALIAVSLSAAVFYSWRITSKVRVEYPAPPPNVKIGVYTGSSCVTAVTEIDWGTLMPGDTVKQIVYIRNEGDVSVTLLLSTENWSPPEAEQYMALDWNYTGASISVAAGMNVELRLTIFSNCTGITSFSFTIVITAEA